MFLLWLFIVASAAAQDLGIAYKQIFSFDFTGSDGRLPAARLMSTGDGVFYGITHEGGNSAKGTVFRINQDGSGFAVLHHFRATGGDGQWPYAELIIGPNGNLFGTTELGGTNGDGTVFTLKTDGTDYSILFHFGPSAVTGFMPRGHLQLGSDGTFYSTTQAGGAYNDGAVYKINPDGTGFRVLHHFGANTGDGFDSDAGLTLASDGALYGTCSTGYPQCHGTIFKINQDGTGYTNLHCFLGLAGNDGEEPKGRLLELPDGSLYGVTQRGGLSTDSGPGGGTIFKIRKDGSGYAVLKYLSWSGGDPNAQFSGLLYDTDNTVLYGTTCCSPGSQSSVFKINPDGSGFQILRFIPVVSGVPSSISGFSVISFGTNRTIVGATHTGGVGDGAIFSLKTDGSQYAVLHEFHQISAGPKSPGASLIRANDGLFYGTTELGGISNAGTIFVLNSNGSYFRLLHQFGLTTNAAKTPNGLCEGSDGFLYGTTQAGGAGSLGVIFKIGKNDTNFSVVRPFDGTGDARRPRSALIEGTDGWLYGQTFQGGTNNRGAVYKLQKNGDGYTVLRSFTNAPDGNGPIGELAQLPNGILFGTTTSGGISNAGTIFRINSDGSEYARMHDFVGSSDGQSPQVGLAIGNDGRLYGTTTRSNSSTIAGTIFRIDSDGDDYRVLYQFADASISGRDPRLIRDGGDGFLYGITTSAGPKSKGTLFRLSKDGAQCSALWAFPASASDGVTPTAGLTPVGDGSFLGVTTQGGDLGNGTVFRFDPTPVRLGIRSDPPNVDISWPASSTVDVLQATERSSLSEWHAVDTAVTREGALLKCRPTNQNASRYFRVLRDWQ